VETTTNSRLQTFLTCAAVNYGNAQYSLILQTIHSVNAKEDHAALRHVPRPNDSIISISSNSADVPLHNCRLITPYPVLEI
jgi:hypothetical protein